MALDLALGKWDPPQIDALWWKPSGRPALGQDDIPNPERTPALSCPFTLSCPPWPCGPRRSATSWPQTTVTAPPRPRQAPPCRGHGRLGVAERRKRTDQAVATAHMSRNAKAIPPPPGPRGPHLSEPGASTLAQGQQGARSTHLAAAEDVRVGDTHVEMPDHGRGLLPGLEGAVHREAAPSPNLGPELWTHAAVERWARTQSPPRPRLPSSRPRASALPRVGQWCRSAPLPLAPRQADPEMWAAQEVEAQM